MSETWPTSDHGERDRCRGIIGVNHVVNAAPDGYTLLFGSIGTHACDPTIYTKPRYSVGTVFTPVALFAGQPMVLNVRRIFPPIFPRIRRLCEGE